MDCYRSIVSLRAVRSYRPESLSGEQVRRILEAGRWTGSAKNRQPWSFIVIEDEEMRRRVARCGSFASHLVEAPLVVVLVRHPDGYDLDMGRLMQNMMLAAAVEGVGSCPVTLHEEERAREVLGVPPGHGARWAIAFGLPNEARERGARADRRRALGGQPRKPLDELVHHHRWGSREGHPIRAGGQ